jgi:hypothetical protein
MGYSGVISFLAEEAQAVAPSKDANSTAAFKSMLQRLPFRGYETDGDEVLKSNRTLQKPLAQR